MVHESVSGINGGARGGTAEQRVGAPRLQPGTAVQENFSDFEVIRMNESPAVETYIVPSELPPGGFGETAVPPVAPAVANAIFAATGNRLRRLPITPEKLKG